MWAVVGNRSEVEGEACYHPPPIPAAVTTPYTHRTFPARLVISRQCMGRTLASDGRTATS